jgi:hypothetical protein
MWYDASMNKETLELTAVSLFDECVTKVKRQEQVAAGFWLHNELNRGEAPRFFAYGSAISPLLNSGQGKDMLFAITRHWIESCRAEAVYIHTEAWSFQGNEKCDQLEGGWMKHIDTGFKWLVENGYGVVHQVLFIVAQTPEWTTVVSRKFEEMTVNGKRMLVFAGPMESHTQETEKYKGRTKMFGTISEPEVQEYYDRFAPEVGKYLENLTQNEKTAGE